MFKSRRKKINKSFYLIIFLFICLIIFLFIFNNNQAISPSTKIRVAVCPTFYQALKQGLDNNHYSVVLTQSTASSLALLSQNMVDYALGGRILRPEEPAFNYQIIGQGYSFLSHTELSLYDYELNLYPVFSDLDPDLIKNTFGLLNVEVVEDVYQYLRSGLVITSWDNTDYARASIVHLLRFDDSRHIDSRLAILYCVNDCEDDIIVNIKKLID